MVPAQITAWPPRSNLPPFTVSAGSVVQIRSSSSRSTPVSTSPHSTAATLPAVARSIATAAQRPGAKALLGKTRAYRIVFTFRLAGMRHAIPTPQDSARRDDPVNRDLVLWGAARMGPGSGSFGARLEGGRRCGVAAGPRVRSASRSGRFVRGATGRGRLGKSVFQPALGFVRCEGSGRAGVLAAVGFVRRACPRALEIRAVSQPRPGRGG